MAINMKDVIEIDAIPKYIQLEYIHFNGAEYVPTGLYTTIEKYIEIDATVDNVSYSSATPITLFGLEWDYETGSYSTNYDGVFAQFFGDNGPGQTLTNTNRFTTSSIIHRVLDSTNALYLAYEVRPEGSGGALTKSIYSSETDLPSYNPELCLGCSITSNNQKVNFWQGNVYNLVRKTSQYGTTEYNFVPAKRYIDGVAGLYDTVNKVFYPMSGTTTTGTACGPEVSILERYGTKKIEDSNGNIIWGSRSAYPYRRLEYIHFSGSEYILTETPANNYYFLQFSLDSIVNDKFIFGCNGDTTSAGTMRITNRTSSASYMQTRFGRNSSANTNIAAISANNTYQMRLRIYANNTLYSALANSSGTVIGSNSFSAVSFTRANMNKFAIMGYGAGTTATNTSAGKVYWYLKREGDGASTILVRAYPCQRKSDGVCGLYDVINGVFYPMEGTNITDTAAGPLVDEYWDLQA